MREATPIKETCNFTPAGLMTPRDAAVYIGVKINTLAVWRMTNKYGLPFVKLGKVVRYRKTDLDEWINKNVSTDFYVLFLINLSYRIAFTYLKDNTDENSQHIISFGI